ncbi:MAG TPA: hypothetical protein PLI77_08305 [Bacteroidales bacterium]|jgi:type II secretory pathway pseudopilin PulG|nr:hypothetical protein [Bacteroidales bacterium]HPE41070.1 hypothetical protein [Bacteroidales bacterium]
MKVQTIFRIFLVIIVLVLSVMAFRSIMRPEKFKMVYTEREKEIRNRLTTIRAAQQVYKLENKKYAENIDDLVKFIKDGNITIVKISGSIPEGMSEKDAFAKGFITKTEEKYPAAKKVLEIDQNVKEANLKNFQFIPENNGKKFEIQTAKIQNDFQVYRIDVPLDNILANMQRSISPKNTNFITKGINAILYNGLEQEKQYKNLYKPMWLGSLTEAVTTGSWE